MVRQTDTTSWHAALDSATAGVPVRGDNTCEIGLYLVEFRDSAGLFGMRQVSPRAGWSAPFVAYLAGGDG